MEFHVRISFASFRVRALCCLLALALGSGFIIGGQNSAADRSDQHPGRGKFLPYRIIDLGSLGGDPTGADSTTATSVNDVGQVVGFSKLADPNPRGPVHAFVWQDGRMCDLGTLAGITSEALAINNNGQIVGFSSTADGAYHAVLWQDGVIRDLGTLGGPLSYAFGINNKGQVVGRADTATGVSHPFLWQNGQMTDLAELSGDGSLSEAVAINDAEQITGYSFSTGRAFLLENNQVTDLGTLGGNLSIPFGINERGAIVGTSTLPSSEDRAFVYKNGQLIGLSTLGGTIRSIARAISDKGLSVGSSYTAAGEQHAALWHHKKIVDLNMLIPEDSGWFSLTQAFSINESRQIVGIGEKSGVRTAAFLLTPDCDPREDQQDPEDQDL